MASGSLLFVTRITMRGRYFDIQIGAMNPLYPWFVFQALLRLIF
jgi:hypothetical protein